MQPSETRCSICRHEKVEEINALLIGGASLRSLAERYGITRTAACSHKNNHLLAKKTSEPAAIVATGPALSDPNFNGTVIEQVERALSDARALTACASKAGRIALALAGIGRQTTLLDLQARMTGAVSPERPSVAVGVNVTVDARTVLLEEVRQLSLKMRPKLAQEVSDAPALPS